MKLKYIVAGLLAAASFSASAGDKALSVIADGKAHFFAADIGDGILSGGHDLITLDGLGAGTYKIGLTVSGQNLVFDDTASNLHGQHGQAFDVVGLAFFGVKYSGVGPFVLDLAGTAGDGADYGGTYTVSAVPEPEAYGMLLGGLALMGVMARRKAKKSA